MLLAASGRKSEKHIIVVRTHARTHTQSSWHHSAAASPSSAPPSPNISNPGLRKVRSTLLPLLALRYADDAGNTTIYRTRLNSELDPAMATEVSITHSPTPRYFSIHLLASLLSSPMILPPWKLGLPSPT